MATQITNQASLTYNYGVSSTGTAVSNLATAVIQDAFSTQKTAINDSYTAGGTISYSVSVTNNSGSALTNVVVTDNLGAYTIPGGTATAVPLTYTDTARLFINGEFTQNLSPTTTTPTLSFTIPSLGAGDTALIVYTTGTNTSTPLEADSTVTNTATVSATGQTPITDSATVPVSTFADVRMVKNMTPATITDGGAITYTFNIYNYGNTEATNVTITDVFNPIPTITGITITNPDGTTLTVPATDYTLALDGTLTLPTGTSTAITVPPATFTQSPTTGEIIVTPSVTTVTVTGTV